MQHGRYMYSLSWSRLAVTDSSLFAHKKPRKLAVSRRGHELRHVQIITQTQLPRRSIPVSPWALILPRALLLAAVLSEQHAAAEVEEGP